MDVFQAAWQSCGMNEHKGLQLEEPLIFEQGADGRCGVDLADLRGVEARLGKIKPRETIGLPGLSEPQVVRHYTRLSRRKITASIPACSRWGRAR